MYTDTITPVISFCQMHNYFYALAVFMSALDNSLIIISPEKEMERISGIISSHGYVFKIYSESELYKKILGRDMEIVTVFSHAITLLDHIQITPRVLSAIEPIKVYNKQNTLPMKEPNEKYLRSQISVLFCDIDDIPQFIKATFFPLCRMKKKYLSGAQYWIDWRYGLKNNSRDVLVTFFIRPSDRETILRKLQLYLYENVSELQLFGIQIPYARPFNYIDSLPFEICHKTYNVLCIVSEEFVVQNYQEALSDNKKITFLTYYYVLAAKYFFKSLSEFLETNKQLTDIMTNESISPFTKSLLRHDEILDAKNKILYEYKKQSDINKVALHMNYYLLIQDWKDFPEENDSIQESLAILTEIRNHLDLEYIEESNYLLFYFYSFAKIIANCMDLHSYYKGYIPYCINYLVK